MSAQNEAKRRAAVHAREIRETVAVAREALVNLIAAGDDAAEWQACITKLCDSLTFLARMADSVEIAAQGEP